MQTFAEGDDDCIRCAEGQLVPREPLTVVGEALRAINGRTFETLRRKALKLSEIQIPVVKVISPDFLSSL